MPTLLRAPHFILELHLASGYARLVRTELAFQRPEEAAAALNKCQIALQGVALDRMGILLDWRLGPLSTDPHLQVALTNVTGAQRLVEPADDTNSIRITPQPQPNCRIRLSSAVSMRGLFGAPLRGEMLDVYVDDPSGLVASISEIRRVESARPTDSSCSKRLLDVR